MLKFRVFRHCLTCELPTSPLDVALRKKGSKPQSGIVFATQVVKAMRKHRDVPLVQWKARRAQRRVSPTFV